MGFIWKPCTEYTIFSLKNCITVNLNYWHQSWISVLYYLLFLHSWKCFVCCQDMQVLVDTYKLPVIWIFCDFSVAVERSIEREGGEYANSSWESCCGMSDSNEKCSQCDSNPTSPAVQHRDSRDPTPQDAPQHSPSVCHGAQHSSYEMWGVSRKCSICQKSLKVPR